MKNIINASLILSIILMIINYFILDEYTIEWKDGVKLFIFYSLASFMFLNIYSYNHDKKMGSSENDTVAEVFKELDTSNEDNIHISESIPVNVPMFEEEL